MRLVLVLTVAIVMSVWLFAQSAHAQTEDVVILAAEHGVELLDLVAASDTVGVAPVVYLRTTPPHAPPPRSTIAWTIWDRLAECESNGRWHIDRYHDGGLQFLPSTWTAYGGGQFARYAWQASREQQIAIAQRVQRAAGWGQWPACSRRLGLR
jgi:hypothetical protein